MWRLPIKIAKAVRNISGGYRYVKAMGVELKEKGIVQVSMNLTNYKKSPIFRVFETIKREAQRYGVPVVGSEIIGMVPLQAIVDTFSWYLQLDEFSMNRVIEQRLMDENYERLIKEFLGDAIASPLFLWYNNS